MKVVGSAGGDTAAQTSETSMEIATDAIDSLAQFESEVPSVPQATTQTRVAMPPPPSNTVASRAMATSEIGAIRSVVITAERAQTAAPTQVHTAAPTQVVKSSTKVSHSQRSDTVSFDAVVRCLTHVQWIEAVAIVEGVCAAMTAESVPETSDVFLTSDGSILIRSPLRGAPSVERLARMLHVLAGTANIPVPVRLFITKWIAAESGSIRQFASELAFFARPNGAALIRAVYDRCSASRNADQLRETKPAKPDGETGRRRSSLSRWALPAYGVLCFGVLGLWLSRESIELPDQISAAGAAHVLTNVAYTARDVAAGVANRLSVARAETSRSSEVEATAESVGSAKQAAGASQTAAAASAARTRAVRQVVARPRELIALTPVPPLMTVTPNVALVASEAIAERDESPLGATPVPLVVAASRFVDVDDRALYSNVDAGVEPPRIRYPRLPTAPSDSDEDVNSMELLISRQGTVERVKLLSQPDQVMDMMLLHAAKSWVFDPASKEGQTVRYRLVVSWVAAP